MQNGEHLRENIEKQAERLARAEQERPTLLAQTVFLGTLALLFVVPVVVGAYLGRWIDSQLAGYSYRWTISLLITGLMVGGWNVYLYIQKHCRSWQRESPTDDETREKPIEGPPLPSSPRGEATGQLASLDCHQSLRTSYSIALTWASRNSSNC